METLFGTDGIRNKIHHGCLTQDNLVQLGHAIGKWATENFEKPVKILIGQDTRSSCSIIFNALTQGLLQYDVQIFNGKILPTPVICKLVKEEDFSLGLIISASHNLADYNGLKIVKKNAKASTFAESAITKLYEDHNFVTKLPVGSIKSYDQASQLYQIFIAAWFDTEFLENKTIVLDCAHGATYKIAPKIFENFGANVITINNHPDGHNINLECGSTCPNNITTNVLKHNADWGIAFDGDGDRVIIVDKNGHNYDGDEILSVLAQHELLKKSPVVGTIVSNQGLEKHLNQNEKTFLRAKVGDKNVHKVMTQHQALLGGEPSGHIIVDSFSYAGDGIFTSLLFIDTIIKENISKLLFQKFSQVNISLPVESKKDLSQPSFQTVIKKYEQEIDPGKIIIRYSGTEPVLRIMVEGEDEAICKTVAAKLNADLTLEFEKE